MTTPDKKVIQDMIGKYYTGHFSQGTNVEVSMGDITEAEDGSGHVVNAGVKFLRKSSGDSYETKITLPFREGALDWTSLSCTEGSEEHKVGPDKESAVAEKAREPKTIKQPDCCEKPKEAKPHEGGPVEYIQEPEKVGSTEALAGGGDEWLSESEAAAPDPNANPDDWAAEETPTIFEETGVSNAQVLATLQSLRQHADPIPGALKVLTESKPEEPEFEPMDVALLEYYGKRDSDDALYEFKLWFTKEESRRGASDLLQLIEEIEDMREDDGNALAVSVRRTSEDDDPAASVIIALREAGELQVEWQDGHEENYLKEAGDNAGFYHKGVQTNSSAPGQPDIGGGENKPGEEQGGVEKTKHKGVSADQGGSGVGKTKPITVKKKITGSKGESVEEGIKEQADLFTDIVSFDKEEEPGEEGELEPEPEGEEAAVEGALDPVIQELVRAQAENGIDTVLQVAQAQAEETGAEWGPELEQQIRDEFAAAVGEGEAEEELPPEGEEEIVIGDEEPAGEEGGPPWAESQDLGPYLEDMSWLDEINEAELTEVEPMVYEEDELEEKAKLGTGARFKALKKELGSREDGAKDPGALAAWIGRKKHGKGKMDKMAAAGKESKKKDPAISIAEAKQVFELDLTDEEMTALEGGSLTRKAAESLVYEAETAKPKITEALKAVAAHRIKLKEASENDTFLGAMASWQRIQSKKRPSSPYGRVKPNVKFEGKIRVVWDDGEESWEAPGDVQAVSNPRNAKAPSGGAMKPAPVNLSKKGGEEFKMLKSMESLRKIEAGGKRFLKAVEMQLKGQKFDSRLIEVLTESWYEFGEKEEPVKPETDETGKAVEDKKKDEEEKEPLTEDLDTLDDGIIEIIAEDYGDELSVFLPDITEDLGLEDE